MCVCVCCSVSDDLLKSYLDSYADTPWDALKYLIAEANYGGRVTDELDRRLLGSYLSRCVGMGISRGPEASCGSLWGQQECVHGRTVSTCYLHTIVVMFFVHPLPCRFYCEEALDVVNFKLSPLPQYFIPEPGSISSYKDYIHTLPITDRCACVCACQQLARDVAGHGTQQYQAVRLKARRLRLPHMSCT